MKLFRKIGNISSSGKCCPVENESTSEKLKKIILVGSPNVGKSALFNELTDSYVTVSNYPGTTVGITRTVTSINGARYEIIDTPGMYSMLTITEEEKITRDIIFSAKDDIVIHVTDAKNIERMLPLTMQLIESGLPVILVLNMADELGRYGIKIDISVLTKELGIPVLSAVATKGIGINLIRQTISSYVIDNRSAKIPVIYGREIENKIKEIESELIQNNIGSTRLKASLLLQDEISVNKINKIKINEKDESFPLFYDMAVIRQKKATDITAKALTVIESRKVFFTDRLNELMIRPITGIPFLIAVVYVGLYQIVGKLGAGTAVDFIENIVFKNYINPFFIRYVSLLLPWKIVNDLFIGDYGMLTLGLRYAVAIILPIVGTFFFVFAIIEDSGYLPRLAMLIDKVFKKIGLSGRAVIPMVLGLGCSTMATMVTRTLPTKRERIMATMLLALAIPCSAQLGVLFTMLIRYPYALTIWVSIIALIFLIVGYLGAKLLPGNPPIFFMEVPPLRLPTLTNVIVKTYARIVWYFKEVLPLFMIASFFLWIGQITGLFSLLIKGVGYPVKLLGLPEKTASAYIFGFFRRDFGAAGLYDMQKAGLFTLNQLIIAVTTMTLFPACIAQGLMMVKERGRKTGIAIFLFCICIAFIVGYFMNILFVLFKIHL